MAVTLNLLVIPIVAGLAAGTGAVAAYVGASPSAPTPASAALVEPAKLAGKPCDAQTWPYIDSKCLTRAQPRAVRVVTAPRADETTATTDGPPVPGAQASVSAPDQLTSPSGLTSRNTVLHQPNVAAPAKDPKARAKRTDGRAHRGTRTYQVPSESRRGSGAMIVVRPMRLEQFR